MKAVIQSYTLTHNEELNNTYVNNSESGKQTYTRLDIHPLPLSLLMIKHWSNASA